MVPHLPLICVQGALVLTSSLLLQAVLDGEHLFSPLPRISRLNRLSQLPDLSVSAQHVILIVLALSFHICINIGKLLLPSCLIS